MESVTDSLNSEHHWKKHFRLAAICVALGIVVYWLGWAKYLIISILISLGIGFTIRFCRYWLSSQYPSLSLFGGYALAVTLSFIVWGLTPIILVVNTQPSHHLGDLQQQTGGFLVGALIMLAVSFIYYRSEQTQRLKHSLYKVELEQIKKDKALLETELRLLQSQIEPHFLFNTLANIQALMSVDIAQANKMLTALTTLLRQSLDRTRTEWLTLGHELKFNEAYLEIQKIRLGDRLSIETQIDKQRIDHVPFPPMLLQPLLENAITHGIEQCRTGGQLTLKIQPQNERLHIAVINTANRQGSQHKGTQVGLRNVRERLQQLYGEQGLLTFDDSERDWVSVIMEVPINVPHH